VLRQAPTARRPAWSYPFRDAVGSSFLVRGRFVEVAVNAATLGVTNRTMTGAANETHPSSQVIPYFSETAA
jgi:hypothetical protein